MSGFEPTVIAFACTYCAYTAADLAGSLRLSYPANVRIVKLTCSGRIEPIHVLKAFEAGADAVFVAGCQPGDCHFLEGNMRGKKWVAYTKDLLTEVGLEPERLEYFHVAASEARQWVAAVEEMTRRARELGPNPLGESGQGQNRKATVKENS
jgi:coenzyme F420-reducing hydrogenase delta subunit